MTLDPRSTRVALVISFCAALGCGFEGDDSATTNASYDEDGVGSVQLELKQTPSGVQCVRIVITNGTALTRTFTVTSGQATDMLDLGKLAAGTTTFSPAAFNIACSSVTSSTVPDWVGDTVSLLVKPGINPVVAVVLQPNVSTAASVDFKQPVKQLVAGFTHTYAIMTTGGVKAWGTRTNGALGDGLTTGLSTVPITSTSLVNVASIGASIHDRHQCLVNTAGALLCWGENGSGQLGDGTTVARTNPVTSVASGIVSVAAGSGFTCALEAPMADGRARIRCTGDNSSGQLGNGNTMSSSIWVNVMGLAYYREVVAGRAHACGLSANNVSCWGDNAFGQIGNGSTGADVLSPSTSVGQSDIIQLAAGSDHTCALKANGTVWCWGRNGAGELGDGTFTGRSAPVQVLGITNAVQIAATRDGGCARLADETVRCWGQGPVGSGSGMLQPSPQPVRNLSGAIALTGGAYHYCVRLSSADLRCWGAGFEGQLGDGAAEQRPTPVSVVW
jgi:alpha-tubulin suppressor-like RCC1 family protein